MRITPEMKKLRGIIVTLFLVMIPSSRGKPLTSHTQDNLLVKNNAENVEFNNTNVVDNETAESSGHNNLLSDLARISTDEDTNAVNRQTVVGTEVYASTSKNSSASEDASNIRTIVSEGPTEPPSTGNFTSPSLSYDMAGSSATSANSDNDMSLVKLSEPTHIVLGKDQESSFSKLVTSNENSPVEAKSNDAVTKPQVLSPLVSARTDGTPAGNKESMISGPITTDEAVKDSGETEQTMEDNPSVNVQTDGLKYRQELQNVQKVRKDVATDHVVVCAGEKQTISCPGETTLNITTADYGYDTSSGCPVDVSSEEPSCRANGVFPVVRSACQGEASCLLQSDGQEFGGMCPGENNFLKVGYSCETKAPSTPSLSDSVSSLPAAPAVSSQLPKTAYDYQNSPYIPHPVQSTQPSYYNNYAYSQPASSYADNQLSPNYYNTAYMNNQSPGKTNYPYNGYYGNQNYNNYLYNPVNHGQPGGGKDRSPISYGFNLRSAPRNAVESPQPLQRQQPPRNNYGSIVDAQYRDYSSTGLPTYDYYNNKNHFNTRNNYDSRYNHQRYLPYRKAYSGSQFPRNSYLGSCYACQNCQQCSEQAYCQGCPKCKQLPCDKKPPKEEQYMDPIDSLVEEFGKKTKGMTPMEMSALVISPPPKNVMRSLPLKPPPKALEDDDGDDDSDENEFTLSPDESNNHEAGDNESQKKASVTPSRSSTHSSNHKESNNKAEQAEKRNEIVHRKNKIYDDEDDEDGYDLKVYQSLLKRPKKKSKVHRHKKVHSKERKSRRRLSKRLLYNEDEDASKIIERNGFELDQNDNRSVDTSYYYDGVMFL